MKIALPLKNENEIFANAGHAPYFGIFELQGAGRFKNFALLEMRGNPRANIEAEHGCTHSHAKMNKDEREAHKKEHDILAQLVKDCSILLIKHACKNTMHVMSEQGIEVRRIPDSVSLTNEALKFALS